MASIDESKSFVPLNIAVLTISDTRSLADDKSGTTLPVACRCSVSSPIAVAVFSAASMSPGSMKPGRFFSSRLTQTPERQSACSSTLTWSAFASALLPACCCSRFTRGRMPSRFWM